MSAATRVPDLTIRQLRTVIAVARYQSFLAAAAEMRTSQSAISRTVKQVETTLGLALFTRSTRHVALTAAGAEFVPVAERVLEDLGIGIENLSMMVEAQRGRLAVAALISLTFEVIPVALAAFWRESPNVEIQLRQRLQTHVLDDVRGGAVDIGIANLVEQDERLGTVTVGVETFLAMLPADHPLARRDRIRFGDLAAERMISVGPASNVRKMLDGLALTQGVTLDHAITLDQITMVGRFVRLGLGVSLVPASMRAEAADPLVVYRPLDDPNLKTEIAAYYLRERGLSPAAERFVHALRDAFSGVTGGPGTMNIPAPR